MNSQELVNAILYLSPNAEFSFSNGDLDTIVWHKLKTDQPSKEQILAAVELAKAAQESERLAKESTKAELLSKLGLTADELAIILG
jgi:hypothetical protein